MTEFARIEILYDGTAFRGDFADFTDAAEWVCRTLRVLIEENGLSKATQIQVRRIA